MLDGLMNFKTAESVGRQWPIWLQSKHVPQSPSFNSVCDPLYSLLSVLCGLCPHSCRTSLTVANTCPIPPWYMKCNSTVQTQSELSSFFIFVSVIINNVSCLCVNSSSSCASTSLGFISVKLTAQFSKHQKHGTYIHTASLFLAV